MQVDTQPFHVNTIDIACKKVFVWPEMADKGKSKDIIIGDPRTSNISQKEVARKALDNKTNKSGGAGGHTQLRSRARQPDLSIADGPAPTCRLSQKVRPWSEASASTQSKERDARAKPT
jgi:hypothetical protein